MSRPGPDSLDADIEKLLAAERPIERPPLIVEERLLARFHSQIAAVPWGGSHGSGGSNAGNGHAARGGGVDSPSIGAASMWTGLARPLTALATAFGLGGAAGAAVHGATATPQIVYVDRVVAASSSVAAPSPIPSSTTSQLSSSSTPPPVERRLPVRAAPSGEILTLPKGEQLAAERAMLDVARAAVGEGNGAAAIQVIERHEKQFPSGFLVEEREALAIRALVLEGRTVEARTRAARFEREFPGSLALGAIRRALE